MKIKTSLLFLLMVLTLAFSSVATSAPQSCSGECHRAFAACANAATTQSELSQCKKSFNGCIHSCKSK